MFTLRVLGGAAVHGPDGPVTGRVGQRRRLALLTVLALGGPRACTRDRLVALFWPESDADRARHSLADAVYQIRRDLGEQAIVTRGEELAVDPAIVGSDAAAFEAAIARGDLREAAALYAGPLLDGVHLADAPEFERWVDERRAALARSFAAVLERLAAEAAGAGRHAEAVEWWRRLAAIEPYDARVALGLMSALEAAGDRAGAIRHARVHVALLEQELGAAPDARVSALAERLRRGEGADGAEAPAPPVAPAERPAGEPVAVGPSVGDVRADTARRDRRRRLTSGSLVVAAAVAAVAVALSLGDRLTGAESRAAAAPSALAADRRSVVVLPCDNVGGDPANAHVSDGLTDELTAMLARVQSLRVVARTSASAFKGRAGDVREIARRLGADAVVECGVRRSGDRVRVTAQLVSGADGMHLWAETYERDGADLLAIQGDLALRIARGLRATLTPRERSRLDRAATSNPEAHALYLKGRHFSGQRTPESVDRAVTYFRRAIALDSLYAAAHAGLARAYSLQAVLGAEPPLEAATRMRAAATRAIVLDGESAEAHAELGAYLNIYAWDSEGSERAFVRSLALDPDNGLARLLYSNLLHAVGRLDEAIAQRRAAVALDPLTPQFSTSLGHGLLAAGRVDESLAAFREAVELDTAYWAAHAGLGEYHAARGDHAAAVRALRRAVALAPGQVIARAGLARALAESGSRDEAREMVAALRADGERRGIHAPAVALAMAALGDVEGALGWLERAADEKHPQLRLMRRLSEGRLAEQPRYRELLRRVGLSATRAGSDPGV